MNPSTRTIVGAGFGAFCMVMFGEAIYHLAVIGTCASGGPYVIGRTCPPGSGWWILAVIGAAIGLALAAVVVGSGAIFLIAGLFLAGGVGAVLALTDGSASASGSSTGIAIMLGVWALLALGWLAAMLVGKRKKRLAAALLDHGKAAWATLEKVDDTGITMNNNPRVRLTLRVRPEGAPEFEAHKAITVPRVAIPQVGQTFPVWYDPADPHKLALGFPNTAEGKEAIAKAGSLGRPPAEIGSVLQRHEPEESVPDGLDQLKKLGELRDSGVLSQAEFEAQKGKILAGL